MLKLLKKDGLVMISIAIIPFFYYSYNNLPSSNVFETYLITFQTSETPIYIFAYLLIGKLTALFISVLFYIFNNRGWKIVILIPITMYLFQISLMLYDELQIVKLNTSALISLVLILLTLIVLFYLSQLYIGLLNKN
ncbi:hypothetical protein [Dokdonia pacifica]|nr:hypothetical protein [Dokdonia pacifica]